MATAPTFNLSTSYQGPTSWNVDPKTQTVSGQLEQVMASDSPLLQQARTRATQAMNSRGLSNSSMAVGAADSAMYDVAMPIAQANASTYATAAKSNTDAANAFAQDSNTRRFQADTANFNLGANDWTAQQDFGRQTQRDATQQQYTLDTLGKQQSFQREQLATQNANDLAKIDKQTAAARDVADIEANYKNLTQGSAAATSIVNKMQDALTALMNNKDITDQTKRDAYALDIKRNAMESLNLVGAIAGDVDLSKFISDIGL